MAVNSSTGTTRRVVELSAKLVVYLGTGTN